MEHTKSSPGATASAAPVVRPADQVPVKNVAAGRDTSMQVLVGPEEGAPNFVLRRFRMEKGGGIPAHTNEVEHEQYVLRGACAHQDRRRGPRRSSGRHALHPRRRASFLRSDRGALRVSLRGSQLA